MPVTDPIADMLVIIKNGVRAKKDSVMVKSSNVHLNILEILKREGFVSNYKKINDNKQGTIKVYLRYDKETSYITDLRRVSKPGLRKYVKNDEIKSVYGGLGVALVSTSQGIMTDKEAKEKNLGGEILCEIW
jgi:small subunit ribosomal protein S8